MTKFIRIFGKTGSALGMLAGLLELSIGTYILGWIGNKESPVLLGIITILLSLAAFCSVHLACGESQPTNNQKVIRFLGVLLPAAICFTTVGRLWYLPGALLVGTSLLLAYQYWFARASDGQQAKVVVKPKRNAVLGIIGCSLILISILLAFFVPDFVPFQKEAFVGTGSTQVTILPMDVLRVTPLKDGSTAATEIEVLGVMIVYLLMIVGSAVSLISMLANARAVSLAGGGMVLAGLIVFLLYLPAILAKAGIVTESVFTLAGSLGLGWYSALLGTGVIFWANLSNRALEKKA